MLTIALEFVVWPSESTLYNTRRLPISEQWKIGQWNVATKLTRAICGCRIVHGPTLTYSIGLWSLGALLVWTQVLVLGWWKSAH